MNKFLTLALVVCCTVGVVYAAKYTINSSGVVKTNSGQVVTSPGNTVNQNYYNNYYLQSYTNNNIISQEQAGIIEIVMDFSGSMSNWINVARRSMSTIVSQIPPTTKLGFRVFGHDNYGNNPASIHTLQDVKKIVKNGNKFMVVTSRGPIGTTAGACSATQQVAAVTTANSNAILSGMNSVDIGGATPLVYALDRAIYQDFASFDTTTPKKIILITDGGENCGGDPCAFAKSLMRKRSDVHIDVILASSSSKALTCLASTTNGHFYNVNNLSDFSATMTESMKAEPQAPVKNHSQKYEYIND